VKEGNLTGPPTLRLPIRFGSGIGIGIGDPTLTMTIGQLRKIMAYLINDLSLVLVWKGGSPILDILQLRLQIHLAPALIRPPALTATYVTVAKGCMGQVD